jgi:hypothetical protein
MLYVMWESSVLVAIAYFTRSCALGWMTNESYINFREGKSFLSSSKHLYYI